jgi:CDP-6-deoxy-D-xylo-4-hexulose-3-dehydrase
MRCHLKLLRFQLRVEMKTTGKESLNYHVPLSQSEIGEAEILEAIRVLRSGRVTMGAECERFEKLLAEYLNVPYAVMVNSGSSANLLALFAVSNPHLSRLSDRRPLKPGDEVIVPALTWSTTVWPILQAGLVPVFVDCNLETMQSEEAVLLNAIGTRTKAIFPVHVMGAVTPLTSLLKKLSKESIWVLEDTCEALGAKEGSRFAGTSGDVGTYSFFFSHHLTTIEGGLVVTRDPAIYELLKSMRAHGWARGASPDFVNASLQDTPDAIEIDPRYLFLTTGFNLRPTEINAAIGSAQIGRLKENGARRRLIYQKWAHDFADLKAKLGISFLETHDDITASPFGFPLICRDGRERDRLRARLESAGIETRPVICGNLTRQPALQGHHYRVAGSLANADRIMDCGLYWGLYPTMTDSQMDLVSQTIWSFFHEKSAHIGDLGAGR